MAQRVHGTLTAATVATVTVDAPAEAPGSRDVRRINSVEVLNRGSSDPIFFTVDADDPTVGGDDTYVAPPDSGMEVPIRSANQAEVRLISVGAVEYG